SAKFCTELLRTTYGEILKLRCGETAAEPAHSPDRFTTASFSKRSCDGVETFLPVARVGKLRRNPAMRIVPCSGDKRGQMQCSFRNQAVGPSSTLEHSNRSRRRLDGKQSEIRDQRSVVRVIRARYNFCMLTRN